jgi:hypothetical protein
MFEMWRPGRHGERLALMLALAILLLVVGVPSLFEPSTLSLAQAVRELGPISGWRCARNATYVYDPRRDSPDASLLSEAPEKVLWDQIPELQVERVEANLRSGDAVVWTRIVGEDDAIVERRVYVLSPGRLQTIGIDRNSGWTAICNSHLGDWHIVAEHGVTPDTPLTPDP